jgi:hypothetical protein
VRTWTGARHLGTPERGTPTWTGAPRGQVPDTSGHLGARHLGTPERVEPRAPHASGPIDNGRLRLRRFGVAFVTGGSGRSGRRLLVHHEHVLGLAFPELNLSVDSPSELTGFFAYRARGLGRGGLFHRAIVRSPPFRRWRLASRRGVNVTEGRVRPSCYTARIRSPQNAGCPIGTRCQTPRRRHLGGDSGRDGMHQLVDSRPFMSRESHGQSHPACLQRHFWSKRSNPDGPLGWRSPLTSVAFGRDHGRPLGLQQRTGN